MKKELRKEAFMGTLKKTTIKEQVCDLIRQRILDQTYTFGEKINMLELSQELGVSNSPIREALSILESEHLITFVPNAGPKVIQIDEKIFEEVQQTARILLIGSYEQCLQQGLIPQLILEMEKHLSRQKALIGDTSPESGHAFAKIAIEFDVSLIKILKNETLEGLYAGFFNLLYLVVLYDHQNSDTDRAMNVAEHEQILAALKNGEPTAVKTQLQLHFSRTIAAP